MYQTPKAIHFRATNKGEEVRTELALKTRWTVANSLGNVNMLNLSDDQFQAIGRALDKVNKILVKADYGFQISLNN
jgi:hypothetical protein